MGEKATWGGVFTNERWRIRAMFSGPVCGSEMLPTDVTVVKTALEIFKIARWARIMALTLETKINFLVGKINLSA
ncbi:hypothetical protein V6N13_133863 [Hibiscus sabdariffa]